MAIKDFFNFLFDNQGNQISTNSIGNIATWKADTVSDGILRTHSFIAKLAPPAALPDWASAQRSITLRSETTVLPGIGFIEAENLKHYGVGPVHSQPYNTIQTDIAINHIIDAKGDIYQFFVDWMNAIVKFGAPSGPTNETFYTVGYFDDVKTNMEVLMYGEDGNVVKSILFNEIIPVSMNPIELNWGVENELAKLTVNYRFTDWNII